MNLNNNNPLYIEIVNEYKKFIEMNVYKYNDKLPSVRSLALELGINPNTVQRAYKILEDDGYIKTIEKKGIYVSYNNSNDNIQKEKLKKQIQLFKDNSITKETLLAIVKEVYND